MKLKKRALPWLIISILIIVGEIGLTIYRVINNSIDTLDLIINLLVVFVTIANIFTCFEKKDK